MDLSNNFLFPNDYGIPFLWISSRNFYYFLGLILFWSLLTSSPSRWSSFLSMSSSCLFILYVFSKHGISFHVTSNRGLEFVLNFFYFLGTALDIQLHFTSCYYPKGDKQAECINQTPEQYMFWVLLPVSFYSLLIRSIIQTLLFTLNVILLCFLSWTWLPFSFSEQLAQCSGLYCLFQVGLELLCYDLSSELRLHLDKDLREEKGRCSIGKA